MEAATHKKGEEEFDHEIAKLLLGGTAAIVGAIIGVAWLVAQGIKIVRSLSHP